MKRSFILSAIVLCLLGSVATTSAFAYGRHHHRHHHKK